jgi:hypothetical protein
MDAKAISDNQRSAIIPFFWGHALSLELRDFEKDYFVHVPDYMDRLRMYATNGSALTALVDGVPTVCWGEIPLWNGVSEFWMLGSHRLNDAPLSVSRGAMRYFNRIAVEKKLHRLQITVDMRNDVALKWAKWLKFRPEGVLRRYGPDGSDHMMFARTPE